MKIYKNPGLFNPNYGHWSFYLAVFDKSIRLHVTNQRNVFNPRNLSYILGGNYRFSNGRTYHDIFALQHVHVEYCICPNSQIFQIISSQGWNNSFLSRLPSLMSKTPPHPSPEFGSTKENCYWLWWNLTSWQNLHLEFQKLLPLKR